MLRRLHTGKWGLRDYGTATWDGGDLGCDHSHFLGGNGEASAKQVTSSGTQKYQYRNICGKCGATRIDSQIGLEPTPEAYVEKLVAVFREVRRVLRDDGTLWLNLGDSYAGSGKCSGRTWEDGKIPKMSGKQHSNTGSLSVGRSDIPNGIKPKDLCGIPWRVAFALQADGWWLRQDIIWHKPNPMPESVTDRCTKAHEYIFLLTKSARYFYDAEAVKIKGAGNKWGRYHNPKYGEGSGGRMQSAKEMTAAEYIEKYQNCNRRSVWTITTKPFNMWAETYHLRRVEGDDVSGDMLRKPSPRCPVHAYQDFPCDVCAGSRLIHSQHTFPRPVDMRDALLTEISRQSGQSNPLSNMGCSALRYFLSATEHSNGNRKMDPVLLTILPCISSGEIASRIGHRPEALEKIDSAVRTFENSILADSFSDEREIDLLAQTLFHSVDKSFSIPPDCLCHYYHKKNSKSSHFATFPEQIPEICIKAGTSEKGCCPECGSPWERVINIIDHIGHKVRLDEKHFKCAPGPHGSNRREFTGWRPTCMCGEYGPCATDDITHLGTIPCTVLDPFSGAGTTGNVAERLGRKYIGIELNPTYSEMGEKRIEAVRLPLFG